MLERSSSEIDTCGMAVKRKIAFEKGATDLSSPEAVERFREAAAEFTKEATRSKESARKALVEAGIYTKSGKLTKNYR
jgi:hypothetical protein